MTSASRTVVDPRPSANPGVPPDPPPSPRTTDSIIELEPAPFQFNEAAPVRLRARIGAVRRLGY